MVCKYICVAQPYLCLESVLENTLNTSAAKASVSAVPRASEVNYVVNHIMGILVLISRLCANLLCYTRATGVKVSVLARFQQLTAASASSGESCEAGPCCRLPLSCKWRSRREILARAPRSQHLPLRPPASPRPHQAPPTTTLPARQSKASPAHQPAAEPLPCVITSDQAIRGGEMPAARLFP